jgi:hypothetical protein
MGEIRRFAVLSSDAAAKLSRVDDLSYRAGMLVVNPAGLYKPKY